MRDADTFGALADPTRLAIVRLLAEEALRPSEIAEAIGTTRPLTSRHLKVLREAGIVEDEILRDDGRQRVYRLRPEPFDAIRTFLEEVEAAWDEQLQAFKAHAEGKKR